MLTKEFLIEEYLNKKKPMHQISEENHIAIGTIHKYIKRYNIPSRPIMTEESRKKISMAKIGKTSPRKGVKVSEETRKRMSESKKGKLRVHSKYGGYTKIRNGYIYVFKPDHPLATKDGMVFEHILAYEHYHNCIVDRSKYVIHHIDGNKKNNNPENLLLMTRSEHTGYHAKQRINKRRKQKL